MAGVPDFAGFEDLVEIGRGGFGVVYRARQTDFNRTVAVKVLSGILNEDARQRFARERRAMGSVSAHPNIVTIHASGFTTDGNPFLVMEYMGGGALADRLRDGPIPWKEVAKIGVKLADALAAAHRAGILHRDIKPENVLVSDYDEPKLADFGIARFHGSFETRSGIVATPGYAPPEVLNGQPPTEASDVYSLAATLFTLIAGESPFVRRTDESMIPVIARVMTEPPPDLRPRGVPDGVCTTIEEALAKDPATRLLSATDFGRRLSFHSGIGDSERTRPVETALPLSTPDRPSRPTRRRRRLALAVVAVVAATLVSGVIAVALTRDQGEKGGAGSTPSTSRSQPATPTVVALPRADAAPPFPEEIEGFAPEGSPVNAPRLRAFSEMANYIPDFPSVMNACDNARIVTRWRAIGGQVTAGRADHQPNPVPPATPSDLREAATGEAGLIIGDFCEEAAFFVPEDAGFTLIDIAVEYQVWGAVP